MQVTVNQKMKEWVAEYIRSHRQEGRISIHVVFSKFNEDFHTTFKMDAVAAVNMLIAEGFLKGCPAKGGYSIWLAEDAGKGQSRPSRSPMKQVSETKKKSVFPTVKNGGSPVKNSDVNIEPQYAYENIPHPKTGKVDVLELIGYIMQSLFSRLPSEPKMDGGYAIGKISLTTTLHELGIPQGQRPELSRILQEMALIKRYGKSEWGLMDTKAIQYFITPRLYMIAKGSLIERQHRNGEVARLRRKLAPKNAQNSETTAADTSYEEEALNALIEAEALSKELDKMRSRVAELETERDKLVAERDKLASELEKRPVAEEAAKQEFNRRLEAIRKARS